MRDPFAVVVPAALAKRRAEHVAELADLAISRQFCEIANRLESASRSAGSLRAV